MSLNFSLTNVKDWNTDKTTHPEDIGFDSNTHSVRWHPVVDALAWLSLICDFGEITEKNADMVKRRIAQYQHVFGGYLIIGSTSVPITDKDVDDYIGFSTNVSTKSETAWNKKLADMIADAAKRGHGRNDQLSVTELLEYLYIYDDQAGRYYGGSAKKEPLRKRSA